MIKSMTGYGRARETRNKRDITVEVRSVNNRYLDCTVKMPRMYAFAEDAVKKHVQQAVSRGKVDVFITVDATAAGVAKVEVDRGAAGQDEAPPPPQPPGPRPPRGPRRGQHSEACRRQAHGDQQPGQHQQPQGVLGPPGDFFPEHPPQDQQGQDQHRGRDQNLCHGFSPPFSKMADSSARSSSVRARLSTMALTSSPRLPP